MHATSLIHEIFKRMNTTKKGTIFTNNDFYDIGSPTAVRKALSRLSEDKKVIRLIDGFYTIPYYIESIQEFSLPTTDELAQKIAFKNGWNIVPYGVTALNQVGLSTQVPTVCEYVSDGPYRQYVYLDKTIKFNHTSNRYISNMSKPIALLVQSIKALGNQNIHRKELKVLQNYKQKYIHENILQETKNIQVWIYEIIKKIVEVN